MDIVERLTNKPEPCRRYSAEDDALRSEAAAAITALRKRVEELEGALEPLILPHQYWMDEYPDGALCPLYNRLTWGDHRRARAALRAKGGE